MLIEISCPVGNIFARVLEQLLCEKGWERGINALDDISSPDPDDVFRYSFDGCVHPQKVQRLRQSLCNPQQFPVLNPEEMVRVEKACAFTEAERTRLYAAIVAASMQEVLQKRLNNPAAAYVVVERLFETLANVFLRDQEEQGPLSTFRHQDETMMQKNEAFFEEALNLIDRATIALQLGGSITGRFSPHLRHVSPSKPEQVNQAQEAQQALQNAIALLESMQFSAQQEESWQYWHGEARNSLQLAKISCAS